jgi:maltooligosyltrehalose trehalohydrolase
LEWAEVAHGTHAAMLDWHRRLIALRKATPELSDPRLDLVQVRYDASARWVVVERGGVRVVGNLAGSGQTVPLDRAGSEVLLASDDLALPDGAGLRLPPESVAIVRA